MTEAIVQASPNDPKKIWLLTAVALNLLNPLAANAVSTDLVSIFGLKQNLFSPTSVSANTKAIAPCQASALRGVAQGWSRDSQSLGGNFYITNKSSRPCALNTSSRMQIVDGQGQPLPIGRPLTSGFWGSPVRSSFVLKPNDSLFALVVWGNWCRSAPKWDISIRITLPANGGQITMPIRDKRGIPLRITPPCSERNKPSYSMLQYLDTSSSRSDRSL
ncbi:hypothetical protein [Aerosakkonema funiforme]|uniref:hypothetical protein n=1 Tax=Aerosakkonema funiforme TaxID=1246630 RepID=UPI0035B6DE39